MRKPQHLQRSVTEHTDMGEEPRNLDFCLTNIFHLEVEPNQTVSGPPKLEDARTRPEISHTYSDVPLGMTPIGGAHHQALMDGTS